MTTFEHGKAPAWACATWRHYSDAPEHQDTAWTLREGFDPMDVMALAVCGSVEQIEAVCRALSLAKLAEDWAAATKNLDAIVDARGDMFLESNEANAACVKSDAARALLMKACAE